jgi:hypothetical protein
LSQLGLFENYQFKKPKNNKNILHSINMNVRQLDVSATLKIDEKSKNLIEKII